MPYATRIRQNKPLKQPPQFPPPHVVLHPDDASNRVFLAIARALLSVDNRAMTIKDLAEMSANYGLACQNVSAAGQAITSYIRTHMQRCDAQQDHPLLLRHVLSGTNADDDLLPALYSRSGGACYYVALDNRVTNFRRGTMVWYLSRAAGAPCPFARAGIRLCDYSENGESAISSTRDNKTDEHDGAVRIMRGQKRKRADRSYCSTDSASKEDQRPFKVKLTLRLPPSSPLLFPHYGSVSSTSVGSTDVIGIRDSSTDSQVDFMDLSRSDATNVTPCSSPPRLALRLSFPRPSSPSTPLSTLGNNYPSPPVSSSLGSPPPDSEDEDDYHISMTSFRQFMSERSHSSDIDMESDDFDSDADGDTLWESPVFRSPSAPMVLETMEYKIKQEPHDVQGMLDAWDDLDNSIADVKVIEVLTRAATGVLPSREVDSARHFENYLSQDEWQYSHFEESRSGDGDFDVDSLFHAATRITPTVAQGHSFCDRECLLALCDAQHKFIKSMDLRQSARNAESQNDKFSLTSLIRNLSMTSTNLAISPSSLLFPPPTCVSPQETRCHGLAPPVVVVHTRGPTSPPIYATQVEDISVYQMILGSHIFLRRIDTDFVNLTPITRYAGAHLSILNSLSNITIITKGSPIVSGTWVPLSIAQAYVQEHPVPGGVLDTFLSDKLYEEFPKALQDFHLSNTSGRMLNQFGRHFGSTIQAMQSNAQKETANKRALSEDDERELRTDSPLSAREQEIFHALCHIPEENGEGGGERSLRRSKRVAAARRGRAR